MEYAVPNCYSILMPELVYTLCGVRHSAVVNDARQQIKTLTAQIDKVRKQQAIADKGLLAAETNEASTATAEDVALENKLKDQIEQHNAVYKKGFNDLSELKKEIQHIQKLLAPQDGRQSFTQEAACPLEARVHVTHENRPSRAFTGVSRRSCFFVIDDQWAFVYSRSAEDGVSGFYEALDVLKRRNARK
ncbi:hypothetical protein PINS_up013731 [Pythium insidiosum]|nr:hypothetical protein PINS_up013731 [Pythium insidiosum]